MRLSIRIEATYQTGDAERTQPIALRVVLFQFGNVAANENAIRERKKAFFSISKPFQLEATRRRQGRKIGSISNPAHFSHT